MPRLTVRRVRGLLRRPGADRGASATLVAVLLAGGVLLGMTALVVDVGKLYAEREELMSGADAAAMAVALDCANDGPGCADAAAAAATALTYAGDNARDAVSHAVVCGNRTPLPSCDSAPVGNLTDCLGERPEDIAYVEVRTTTLLPDGSTLLPPSFAQTLVSGYDGTTVGACSRVAWGSPGSGLAVTISTCEWGKATDGGTDLAPPPPPDPDPSYERVIFLHTNNPDCDEPNPGFDGPGGFGWLDDGTADNCQVVITEDEFGEFWYRTDPGNNVPQPCRDLLADARQDRTLLLVPVFDLVRGVGANLEYHLHSMATFVVTGYHLPSLNAPSILPGSTITECKGNDFCIYGYFTEAVESGPIGPLPGGFGATVVKTIG